MNYRELSKRLRALGCLKSPVEVVDHIESGLILLLEKEL